MSNDDDDTSPKPSTASSPADQPIMLARDVHLLPPSAVGFDRIGRPIDARGKAVKGGVKVVTNHKGRPRSGTAFAEAVRELVEPREVIGLALIIARGQPVVRDLNYLRDANKAKREGREPPPIEGVEVQWPTTSERLAAMTFLRDAGYSKPAQQLEIAPAPAPPMLDYSKLTDEELDELERLHNKALNERSGG